jgi:hypothetical protein
MQGRRKVRFLASLTAALAVAIVPVASGQGEPGKTDGIENARAAGMKIDPRAEALMARAPIGTCANDPTLAKCPPARAVVFNGSSSYADDDVPAAALAKAGAKIARRRTPVAHAAIDQCRVKVTEQSPYKAVGMAQMDAQNYCNITVTTHEIYGILRKYYNGDWYQMAVKYKCCGVPGKTLYLSGPRYDCTATPLRAWEAKADAYALLRGVWYAGTQSRFDNLYCG